MTNQPSFHPYTGFQALKLAEKLYAKADYLRALDILDGNVVGEGPTIVLRVKVLSRLGRLQEALGVIERNYRAHADAPLLCAIATTVAAQCENFDVVAAWASRVGDPRSISRSRSDAAWYLANGYWISGRCDLAEDVLPVAFSDGSANSALRTRILYALLFAGKERYAQQARILRFAATRAIGEDIENIEVLWLAIATETLCGLASEIPGVVGLRELQQIYDAVKWPSSLSAAHFQATQSLGWRYAISGDYATAYELLRTARSIAPTLAFRLFAQVDLALFAREAGEVYHAQLYLREALISARALDVSKVVGEERFVFIALAELLAKPDPQAAQQWLHAYDASSARRGRLNAFSHDRRLDAAADYARGLVLFHSGRRAEAVRDLRAAHEVFSQIGYEWRSARSARALFEITRDSRWRPQSDRELSGTHNLEKLTRREVEVKDLILRGHNVKEIANLLVLSVHTVENHKKHILEKVGVRSQRDLILRLLPAQ